jgi:hypothetical protein
MAKRQDEMATHRETKNKSEKLEAVAVGIAKHLGLEYEFRRRTATGSGMENMNAPNKRKKRRPPRP